MQLIATFFHAFYGRRTRHSKVITSPNMPPKCSRCGSKIDAVAATCRHCGNGVPPQNVLLAELEEGQLEARVQEAIELARLNGTLRELTALESAISKSKAVISRPYEEFAALAMDANRYFISFSAQVRAGARSPNGSDTDRARAQWENALVPNYAEQIIFGSLSIAERGMRGYGGVAMVLKEDAIRHRSSVFEENGMVFSKRHGIRLDQVLPSGYRATWPNRAKIAVAKFGGKLRPGMTHVDFDKMLQNDNGGGYDDDFIEFHLYGAFNRDVIEKAIASPEPADKAYWESMIDRLKHNNISVATETRP